MEGLTKAQPSGHALRKLFGYRFLNSLFPISRVWMRTEKFRLSTTLTALCEYSHHR